MDGVDVLGQCFVIKVVICVGVVVVVYFCDFGEDDIEFVVLGFVVVVGVDVEGVGGVDFVYLFDVGVFDVVVGGEGYDVFVVEVGELVYGCGLKLVVFFFGEVFKGVVVDYQGGCVGYDEVFVVDVYFGDEVYVFVGDLVFFVFGRSGVVEVLVDIFYEVLVDKGWGGGQIFSVVGGGDEGGFFVVGKVVVCEDVDGGIGLGVGEVWCGMGLGIFFWFVIIVC